MSNYIRKNLWFLSCYTFIYCFLSIHLFALSDAHEDFENLPPYKHKSVAKQFAEYEKIYEDFASVKDLQFGMVARTSCPELFEITKKGLFSLAKEYLNNSEDICGRREKALDVLKHLYNSLQEKVINGFFTLSDFWNTNLMVAIIIDWYKGMILSSSECRGSTNIDPEMSAVFSKIKIGNPWFLQSSGNPNGQYLNFNDLIVDKIDNDAFYGFNNIIDDAFIIYTNCSSAISEIRLAENLLQRANTIYTVFDCTLAPKNSRFESDNYLPHNGRLSTSTNLYHDRNHSSGGFIVFSFGANKDEKRHIYKSLKKLFENAKNGSSDEDKIVSKALFFLNHEISNLGSFLGSASLGSFESFISGGGKENPGEIFTSFGLFLKRLEINMPALIAAETRRIYLGEARPYTRTGYKILMRDWELMLHRELPLPSRMNKDSIKFTYASLFDINDRAFLPSLDELLKSLYDQAADGNFFAECPQLNRDNKAHTWKLLSKNPEIKSLQLKLKNKALVDAYTRFWQSFFTVVLEREPSLLLKEEYLAPYQQFKSGNPEAIDELKEQNKELYDKFFQTLRENEKLGIGKIKAFF